MVDTFLDRVKDLPVMLFQSEEHWVFHVEVGDMPCIGGEMYVLPTHTCPTVALYAEAHIIGADGRWRESWEIASRARKLLI